MSRRKPQKRAAPQREPASEIDIPAPAADIAALAPIIWPEGARPKGEAPIILPVEPSQHYALVDCGNGRKLERYGPYLIERPEGQALWPPQLPARDWSNADAVFTGNTEEEGMGRWRFDHTPLGETWPMIQSSEAGDVSYLGRFTSFRHVGVFPEQAPHWNHMAGQIMAAKRPVKVLNLFGYTGLAALIAAQAGASVTHVDASKKAIGWARENQEMAGLQDKPIRWICEDASKFVQREARRGNSYDIILADPPAYGRGPKGEVWSFFEDLPRFLLECRSILAPNALSMVLTSYTIRASFFAMHEVMREAMRGRDGVVQSGELVLREEAAGRSLSTSLFSRWVGEGA